MRKERHPSAEVNRGMKRFKFTLCLFRKWLGPGFAVDSRESVPAMSVEID
jgi:hypothetical protein